MNTHSDDLDDDLPFGPLTRWQRLMIFWWWTPKYWVLDWADYVRAFFVGWAWQLVFSVAAGWRIGRAEDDLSVQTRTNYALTVKWAARRKLNMWRRSLEVPDGPNGTLPYGSAVPPCWDQPRFPTRADFWVLVD